MFLKSVFSFKKSGNGKIGIFFVFLGLGCLLGIGILVQMSLVETKPSMEVKTDLEERDFPDLVLSGEAYGINRLFEIADDPKLESEIGYDAYLGLLEDLIPSSFDPAQANLEMQWLYMRQASFSAKQYEKNRDRMAFIKALEDLKSIYRNPEYQLSVRSRAGLELIGSFLMGYDRDIALNHFFVGQDFEVFLEGESHWDIWEGMARLSEQIARSQPDLDKTQVLGFLRAADFRLDRVLMDTNLNISEREGLIQQVIKMVNVAGPQVNQIWNEPQVSKFLRYKRLAYFLRIYSRVLVKLDLAVGAGVGPSAEQGWTYFAEAIEILDREPTRGRRQMEAKVRFDWAHLLAETQAETQKIMAILDPLFEAEAEVERGYLRIFFELENVPDREKHFQKRGIHKLGNLDTRFKKMALEAGFSPEFFQTPLPNLYSIQAKTSDPPVDQTPS